MSNGDREHMSSVDTAWLRMERPYNLMMITAVMMFEDKLDFAHLRQAVEFRFMTHRRFKQRVVQQVGGFYWETDPHFELSSHVRRIGLPGTAGKEELEELVSAMMSTPLDPTKPLWQFHLIENYKGGSAIIWRIHHCYADGIALVHHYLSSMAAKTSAGSIGKVVSAPAVIDSHETEVHGGIFRHLFEPIGGAVKAGIDMVEEGVEIISHPFETLSYVRQGVGYVRQGVGLVSEAAKLALMSDDPQTRFKGKPGVAKCVAWAEPLPLLEVKEIGKALGCSINDVLLASVTGALRSYLVEKGDSVDRGLTIRATVPVNLRPLEKAKDLGNYFGLVMLTLPIGIANPLERLFEVKRRMEELKSSYQAILALGLLGALGLGPKIVQASVTRLLTKKATAVMTNVPGPQEPCYFAGAKAAELMFWVPQTSTIGMGVSIMSYNGRVHFGLVTDKKMVSDPQAIVNRLAGEFEKLVLITMMEPWDRQRNETARAAIPALGSR